MTAAEAQESIRDCTYLKLGPDKPFPDMEPELYKTAIEEYEADVRENPQDYKDMLQYKGE
jgi:hypothetical protein